VVVYVRLELLGRKIGIANTELREDIYIHTQADITRPMFQMLTPYLIGDSYPYAHTPIITPAMSFANKPVASGKHPSE